VRIGKSFAFGLKVFTQELFYYIEVVETDLNEDQTRILNALNSLTEPAGCKVIGEAADMPWRSVMAKLRGLRKAELVESPEKGKYVISEKGKTAIS
jgi:DNA-binding transcriptional ArsR family regulator